MEFVINLFEIVLDIYEIGICAMIVYFLLQMVKTIIEEVQDLIKKQ